MGTSESADSLPERANDLYWQSDRSVNQIADEMDLSKGMLYGLIRPLTSDLPCPRCSTILEYSNRTARERGLLSCPDCGLKGDEMVVREEWEQAAAGNSGRGLVIPPSDTPSRAPRSAAATRPRHDPLLVGAGLLLVAAGLWLFRGLGRR